MHVPWQAVLLAAAATSSGCASAPSAPRSSAAREEAIRVLETAETFAGPSVGIAGRTSDQACAFAVLVDEPDAADIFRGLLTRARVAGQLYALCGLYLTDASGFARAVEPYRRRPDHVRTLFHDKGGAETVGTLVE